EKCGEREEGKERTSTIMSTTTSLQASFNEAEHNIQNVQVWLQLKQQQQRHPPFCQHDHDEHFIS
ncbi:hypothetical protein RDWZM_008969, partial [Blomia tropicalis]